MLTCLCAALLLSADELWRPFAEWESRGKDTICTGELQEEGTLEDGRPWSGKTEYVVKTRGEVVYQRSEKTRFVAGGTRRSGYEALATPERYLAMSCSQNKDGEKQLTAAATSAKPGPSELLFLTNNMMLAPYGYYSWSFGWNRLSDVIRDHAAAAVREADGAYSAKIPWGQLRWALDPQGKPAWFRLVTAVGDRDIWGKPLSGEAKLLRVETSVEYAPGQVVGSIRTVYADCFSFQRTVNRYQLKPLPANEPEFRLTWSPPDGAPAIMLDDQGGDYEWRDGKVQAKASKKFVQYAATLDANTARPGYGVIIGSILVAGVLLAAVLWLASRLKGAASP